jgi:symplekin
MSCLRALIQHHQAWRSEALGRLLKYTVAPDESMRSPAIRLVANKLFRLTYLSNHVESFAVANLRKACLLSPLVLQQSTAEGDESSGAGKETGGQQVLEEGGQQVMRHYMHLFMALCAQKHDLLHALIDSYVQATPPVRSAVQASITGISPSLSPPLYLPAHLPIAKCKWHAGVVGYGGSPLSLLLWV